MNFFKKIFLAIVFYWILLLPCDLFAQQYIIQPGDELRISFWPDATLNTTLKVAQSGIIRLPIIDEIKAAGLTSSQLSEQITGQISQFRLNISSVSVVVMEYQGNKIYVTGQVMTPGAYSFEVIPNLWRVLQEAGGPLETARLNNITIIRAQDDSKVIEVNLTEYFKKGNLYKLPRLYGGDTIHVPGISAPTTGRGRIGRQTGAREITSSLFLDSKEFYILGEVAAPGRYNFERSLNLLEAVVLAGGSTVEANLSAVKLFNFRGRRDKNGADKSKEFFG